MFDREREEQVEEEEENESSSSIGYPPTKRFRSWADSEDDDDDEEDEAPAEGWGSSDEELPGSSADDLDDGDLKHHTDFRRVYAAMLESWLGVPAAPIVGDGFAPLELFPKA